MRRDELLAASHAGLAAASVRAQFEWKLSADLYAASREALDRHSRALLWAFVD